MSELDEISVVTTSEEETQQVAVALAQVLQPGDVVALVGMLGAGKTCFVKGLVQGFGLKDGSVVTSPSFVLINEYPTSPPLYHVDAYRLCSSRELDELGIDEYFSSEGICVIEWADKVYNSLPPEHATVIIEFESAGRRRVRLSWSGCLKSRRFEALKDIIDRLVGKKKGCFFI